MNSEAKPRAGGPNGFSFLRRVRADLWKFFTSIRLAIVLISLLALLGVAGTLVPQADKTRAVDYIEQYGVEGYRWIQTVQLDRIFSSTYFVFLILLFFVNMTACTGKRLKASLRYARLAQRPKLPQAFERMAVQASAPAEGEGALERARQALRKRHYRVRREGDQLLAEKWRWERFGIDVFHVGILVVLVGGLLTATLGYRVFEVAHKGQTFDVPGRDFQVLVEDFWSENYADTERVMDWHSRLTVLEGGSALKTETIQVNQPMSHAGVEFFQSSFGNDWENAARVTVRVESADGTDLGEYQARVDGFFELPKQNLRVRVGAFLPDFALTENQIAYSRTQRLNNPAAFLQVYNGQNELQFRTWSFSQMPELQRMLSDAPYRFYLTGMTAPEYTGIQVNHDPGMEVALLGFGLMILGILVHLYFKHRQVWVHLDREGNQLVLGGKARHASKGFENEFDRLVQRIQA